MTGAGAREYGASLLFRPESGLEGRMLDIAAAGRGIQAFLENGGADDRARFVLNLAYEELATNVARHAVPAGGRPVAAECSFAIAEGKVTFVFTDDGPAFRPLDPPAGGGEPADPSQGGMGLELVRQFFPDMTYNRRGDRNEVKVTFPCREE